MSHMTTELDAEEPRAMRFFGTLTKGIGRHSELGIPGRIGLMNAPDDWPLVLEPGSLNILVDMARLPPGFEVLGEAQGMKIFDEGNFTPEFTIPRDKIRNNTIGDAQVWRAVFHHEASGKSHECWMLRRIGFALARQIELVSAVRIRNEIPMENGDLVNVIVYHKSHDRDDPD